MKTGITCFIIILLLTGCFHKSGPAPHTKWDAMLQMEINRNHEKPIHFTGLCSKPITDKIKVEMEKSGIKIQTQIENKFTGIGNAQEIRKLSRLKYIKRLEGAKPVKAH